MTKVFKFALALICFLGGVDANAQEHEYKLELNNFTELKLVNGIEVEYFASTDSVGWAYFTCERDMASRILFTKDKKKLKIELDMNDTVVENLPKLRLYSSKLKKVENTSDSTITVHSIGDVEEFKARVVGNGEIVVDSLNAAKADIGINTGSGNVIISSGKVTSVKYLNVGTGVVDAKNLDAKIVKVVLLGTGDVECAVEQQLSVYGSGSGSVYYVGKPEKISNRSIGVKVYDFEEE